jgi:hypothetical protein
VFQIFVQTPLKYKWFGSGGHQMRFIARIDFALANVGWPAFRALQSAALNWISMAPRLANAFFAKDKCIFVVRAATEVADESISTRHHCRFPTRLERIVMPDAREVFCPKLEHGTRELTYFVGLGNREIRRGIFVSPLIMSDGVAMEV